MLSSHPFTYLPKSFTIPSENKNMPFQDIWLDKWTVIVNPSSSAGKAEKDWPKIRYHLQEEGFGFDTHFTEYRGHAVLLTAKLLEKGRSKFIVVGGDGTLNEVVNGILNTREVNPVEIFVGMVPIGTGNDWGRMYKIPSRYKKAVKVLIKGRTFIQDVGRVRYFEEGNPVERYLVNMAGTGYDALVTRRTNELKEKGRAGLIAYLQQLLVGLFRYRQKVMKIEVDGKVVYEGGVFSMNVGICRYNGGGMMQLPRAVPDDGLLDVTIIKKTTRTYILRNLPKVYDGSFVNLDKVLTFRGKTVMITGENAGMLNLEADGESLGNSPFHFDLVPKSIKLIINKSWDETGKDD